MAGDANTGGGGSVYWTVMTNSLEITDSDIKRSDKASVLFHQEGSDKDGDINTDFTVSIKAPRGETAAQFLERLKQELTVDKDRVYFNLAIEDAKDQVRVSWGRQNPNHRGNGGKRSRRPKSYGKDSARAISSPIKRTLGKAKG
jgi:hypothetical protein